MTEQFENYWGIDISKEWLDIAVSNRVTRINNRQDKLMEFIQQHPQQINKALVVLESTGGYERVAVEQLTLAGLTVHVAHPNKVNAFAKAKGRLAKTDRIDAKLLLAYGRFIGPDELRALPSQNQKELQRLGARLEQLKEMHHQESCRLGIASSELLKHSHELLLKVLKQEREAVEQQIQRIIEEEAELSERYRLLQSMKGVGPTLAMMLIVNLPELGKASKKEIAALVGVAPITHQSGQRTGKAMIRYGRRGLRKILYMAALTAARHNVTFKVFYERLIVAGKMKKVAIVAVMRKMLVILNAMIQSKTCFNA